VAFIILGYISSKKNLVLTRPVAKPEANLGYACLSAFLDEIVWLIFATSS
jgi:hypothetical protein